MEKSSGQNSSEVFDVVDESDNVVSQNTRGFIHENGLMHRAVHAVFLDGKGSILLQKRSKKKDSYPLAYTTSCSGHVDAGESYEAALVRETREELGVEIEFSKFQKVGKIPACKETGNEFTGVYFIVFNGEFKTPPDEVDSVEWAKISDFEKLAKENPEKFTPSFLKVYEFFKAKSNL
ncbi:MAG: NUDIX domain-containing protein [Opitutales bacterium]|nr:NUDIX domain-containing protein [Opitutales bacterium]